MNGATEQDSRGRVSTCLSREWVPGKDFGLTGDSVGVARLRRIGTGRSESRNISGKLSSVIKILRILSAPSLD